MEEAAGQWLQPARLPFPDSEPAGADCASASAGPAEDILPAPDTLSEVESGPALRERLELPLAPSLERRRLQLYLLQILIDGAMIAAAFAVTGLLYFGDPFANAAMLQAQLLLPLYWTAAIGLRTYSVAALTRLRFGQSRALLALLAAAMFALVTLFFAKASVAFSRATFALGLGASAVLLAQSRVWFRRIVTARVGATAANMLVLNDGGQAIRVPHAFHVDARRHKLAPNLHDPHMLVAREER